MCGGGAKKEKHQEGKRVTVRTGGGKRGGGEGRGGKEETGGFVWRGYDELKMTLSSSLVSKDHSVC